MLLPLPVQNNIAGIASHRAWHRVTQCKRNLRKFNKLNYDKENNYISNADKCKTDTVLKTKLFE